MRDAQENLLFVAVTLKCRAMSQPISPVCVANLLMLARTYAEHEGLTLTTVGRYFHGTGPIFEMLEGGKRSIYLTTYDSMVAEFRKKWPKGLPWPKLQIPMKSKPRRA